MLRPPEKVNIYPNFFRMMLLCMEAKSEDELYELDVFFQYMIPKCLELGLYMANHETRSENETEYHINMFSIAVYTMRQHEFNVEVKIASAMNAIFETSHLNYQHSQYYVNRLMNYYLRFFAKIIYLCEGIETPTEHYTNEIIELMAIVQMMYQSKKIHALSSDILMPGVSTEFIKEMQAALTYSLQSTIIKDRPPSNELEKLLSIFTKLLINKLLAMRSSLTAEEKERETQSDQGEQIHHLQCIRDGISQIDAVLWRLNLHQFEWIRENLSIHIQRNPLPDNHYLVEKWNRDERRRPVLCHLVNDIMKPDSTEHDLRDKVARDICKASSILYSHIGDLEVLISTLNLLTNKDRYVSNDSFYFKTNGIKKIAIHHIMNLCYDITILRNHAEYLLSGHPQFLELLSHLKFISYIGITYQYLVLLNGTNKASIEVELASLEDYHVRIDVLKHDTLNSAISMFNQIRLDSKIKLAGDDSNKRIKAIENAVREIEYYLNQLPTIKNDEHALLARVFIKDYYLYVMMKCRFEQEYNALYKNDMTKRVASLKVEPGNASIYQFLLKYPDTNSNCLEDLGAKELEELARFYDRKLKNLPDNTENSISLSLQALYIWRAGFLGEQLQRKGSPKQKTLGVLLCAMVNDSYHNSYHLADRLLARISPVKLHYRPPRLDLTPTIEYPNNDITLCHFFDLCNEIRCADTLELIKAINQKLENLKTKHNAIENEFTPLARHKNGLTQQQAELYECERNALMFLSILKSFKIMQMGAKLSEEDRVSYCESVTLMRNLKLNPEGASSLAYGFNSYIVFSSMCILLRITTYSKTAWELFLSDILALMSHLYTHQKCFDTDIKYQYDRYLTKDIYDTLHHAMGVAHSKDKSPVNTAEEFVYWMINAALCRLVPMREAFEENEKDMVDRTHKAESDPFESHFEVLAARNQISKLDSIISRCNLREHSALRKRYISHITSYCLREEYKDIAWMSSNKKIISMAGLLKIDLRSPMKSSDQFKIASILLFCYAQECVLMMGANHLITRGVNDAFPNLQRMTFELLTSINFDSALLYMHACQLYNNEISMTNTADDLRVLHQVSYGLLLSLYRKDAAYTNLSILDFDLEDIPLRLICASGSASTCNAFLEQRLTSELEEASTPEERQRVFKATSKAIEQLCYKWPTVKNDRKNEAAYQLQFISDYYIYALSRCNSDAEAANFTDAKLKKLVFDLKLPSYNAFGREYLYLIINESIKARIRHNISSRETVRIEHLDPAVLPECIRLLDMRIQARGLAIQLWERAPSDNTELINIAPTLLLQILESGEELYHLVNQKYPGIPRKYSTNAKSLLLNETDNSYRYLNLMSKCLDPEKLIYRPMLMKVVEVDKSTFLNNTTANQKINNHKQSAPIKKVEKQSSKSKKAEHKSVKKIDKLDPGSNINGVREYYKNDMVKIQNHYLHILDSSTYKIDKNIKAKAVVGLVACLELLKNVDEQDKLANKIEGYIQSIITGHPKNMLDNLFECNYRELIKTVTKYKKAPPPTPLKHESEAVILVEEPIVSTQIASQMRFMQRRERHYRQEKGQTKSVRPVTQKPSEEGKTDYLLSFRKSISISSIICSQDEIRLMKLLFDRDHYPLIQGGVIGDAILGLPYRDIDVVCFATAEELNELLTTNQKYLNIISFEPMFGIFYRIKFNNLDLNGEAVYFDVAFVAEKDDKISGALIDLAHCFGLSTAIYYCIFTQTIVDPCEQYSRLSKGILNTITSLVDAHKFLMENPDRMLVIIAKEAKCRKYNKKLDTEFIRRIIIANIEYLTITDPAHKFHQSLFDKLFIHGFSKEAGHILHAEYNAMIRLFPMLSNCELDTGFIYKACAKTAERHIILESELIKLGLDPQKRVGTFSQEKQNYLRTMFLDDLLYQKFFDNNYYQRYLTANNLDILIEADTRQYLAQCSFVINRSVLSSLIKMWQQRIYQKLALDRGESVNNQSSVHHIGL